MNIIDHAEKFLGEISRGWKETDSSNGVQVVRFLDKPAALVDTFLTIGLSHHKLDLPNDKTVRHELILPLSGTYSANSINSLLLFVCDLVLENHIGLLRGQTIWLPKVPAQKLGFDAVYCAIPVFMDDAFATFRGSEPSTVIVWLIPIYRGEAEFIESENWEKFEEILEKESPDLFALKRNSVIKPSRKGRRKS